ncbi:zinc transporter 9-like, partial [Stylophora pistillata]|uniref:zinc transporter 9-like n=1 Tax=Stylophora pistillata TaxID=50429 RepID=UPI000C03FB90
CNHKRREPLCFAVFCTPKPFIRQCLANCSLIAVCKFVAGAYTGSSAMLSEAIHSVVDSGNQLLLLYGIKKANQEADDQHPFGYGMELYFWTFVIAILIFAIGAGLSLYKGFLHIQHPSPMNSPYVNYIVLVVSMVFEAIACTIAYREFNKVRESTSFFKAIRHSKDPTIFTVLFEDTAAMIGLIIAFLGVAGSHILGWHILDGVASISIGIVLALVAIFLAIECKGLLIGEAADPLIVNEIRDYLQNDTRIKRTNELLTMHFSPNEILLNASLDFKDGLSAEVVEAAISEFEGSIKSKFPSIRRVFIEAQSWKGHQENALTEGNTES